MGPLLGAIVTAIKYVLEGFGEVIRPVLDLVTEYLLEPLREIGRVIGELIVPILEAIMPIFEQSAKFLIGLFDAIGVVLRPIIDLLNTFLAPVIKVIANILNILTPVLKIFAKVLVTITGTIQYVVQILQHWVATLMNWLAGLNLLGWHPFGGLAMDDPGKPGSYTAYIKNKWGEIDASFDNAGTGINGTDSQTTTTVTNASYSGATTIHLNVYQQGIVVGEGGINQFAIMLRDQLAELNYYGR